MDALIYLIPIALALAGAAVGAFFWTVTSGQYEDLEGAAERILLDDDLEESFRPSDGPKNTD